MADAFTKEHVPIESKCALATPLALARQAPAHRRLAFGTKLLVTRAQIC